VALQIVWTPEASQHFEEILEYWIKRNGSPIYSQKLYQTVKSSLRVLAKYPASGKLTERSGIRVKIVKDYYLFYTYNPDHLVIVGMCDMRRDPNIIQDFLK